MAARPLTNEEKEGLLESLVGGVSGVFTDTGLLFTDRAAFIAGEGSDSPLSQAVRAVSRFQCRLYASDPGRYSASEQNYIGDVCTPYLEGIGEDPIPAEAAAPLVTGGQCPGVLYQVQALGTNTGNGNPIDINRGNFRGPITGAPRTSPPPPTCGPTQQLSNIEFRAGNGSLIIAQVGCAPLPQDLRVVCTPLEPEPGGGCGNAGPQIEPATPRPGLPPLGPGPTINLPGFGDVQVEVGFNPEGQITINLPDLGVSGEVNIGPRGEGGDGGGTGDPTDPGTPGTPVAPGAGEEAEGEAGEGEELVGLLVEVLTAPGSTPRFQNNAALPFRGIGYVRMGYPGRLGVDVSGGTVISPQFFHAQQRGLTSWAVNANVGFSLRTTPYYRTIEE